MIAGIEVYAYYDKKRKKFMFQLLEDVAFTLSNGSKITIPAQYITDGGTVPKYLRWLVPMLDSYFISALIHDWLYDNRIVSRKFADDEMLVWMVKYEVASWKRGLIYTGIRLGGEPHWKQPITH